MPGSNAYVERDPKKALAIARQVVTAYAEDSKFNGLMGMTSNAIIKTQDERHDGVALVEIGFRAPIRSAGTKGNDNLDDGEETKRFYMKVEGTVLAQPVTSKHKKITKASTAANFREEAKEDLAEWLTYKMDAERFAKLSENCTKVVTTKANGTTVFDTTTLAAGDVMTVATLRKGLKAAKNGYTDGAGKFHPKLKPFKTKRETVNGVPATSKVFVAYLGADSITHLRNDPEFDNLMNALSDDDKKLYPFAGAIGLFDEELVVVDVGTWNESDVGCVRSDTPDWIDIHKQTVGGFSTYTAGIDTVTEVNLILGASAGAMPFSQVPEWIEDGTVDSGRKIKMIIDVWTGFEKCKFVGKTAAEIASAYHNEDFGVLAIPTTVV